MLPSLARSLDHPFVPHCQLVPRPPPFAAPFALLRVPDTLPRPTLFEFEFSFSVFQSLELLPAVQDGVCDYRGTTCDRSSSLRTQETKLTFQATTITGRCQCT